MGNTIGGLLKDLEIRLHGDEWLAQVSDKTGAAAEDDKDVSWKPLTDWAQEFEPVHEESEHKKQRKQAIHSKATHVLLNSIDRRTVARVLRLILDVSSQILTLAESKLPNDNDARRIFNNVNGIILSYRFQNDDKRIKFEYFRQCATDNLTATLWECLPRENTAAALVKLQGRVQETLLYLQDEVRPMVEASLDAILAKVNTRVDELVQDRLGDSKVSLAFEERLLQFDQAANQVTQALENVQVMAETVTVAADQAVVGVAGSSSLVQNEREVLHETTTAQAVALEAQVKMQQDLAVIAVHEQAVKAEQDIIASKNAALQKKTQVLNNFAELVKSLVLNKMDQLTTTMVDWMDHLLLAFYEMHLVARVAETKNTNTLKELQDKMHKRVQLFAEHLQEHVEAEVKLVTDTIGAMMLHPQEDEDEEAEKLETDDNVTG